MSDFDFEAVSHIFWEIHEATGRRFHGGCGSYLFDGGVYQYDPSMAAKQQLLARVASEVSSVLEIGTYLGHSLLIMLSRNPTLRVTTIDVDASFAARLDALPESLRNEPAVLLRRAALKEKAGDAAER